MKCFMLTFLRILVKVMKMNNIIMYKHENISIILYNNIVSNNSKFNNFINILNTSNNNILNINLNKKYIGKFNSEVLNNISVMVRNQDLNSIFNEDDTKNRIIFELIIR